MSKKPTGVGCTPAQFRKLNQCVECGKASSIEEGEKCSVCEARNLPHCEMCEIVLRNGLYTFYTYDNQLEHRPNVEFKANKESIREFYYTKEYHELSDKLCSVCYGWQRRIKNKCWGTGMTFQNDKWNYKANGNMHPEYAKLFEPAE